jgi:hypothetical protein
MRLVCKTISGILRSKMNTLAEQDEYVEKGNLPGLRTVNQKEKAIFLLDQPGLRSHSCLIKLV